MPLPCRTIMRAARLPIGRSVLSPPTQALTPGRILPRPGHTISTDTLETAHVAGLAVSPKLPESPGAVFDFNPRDTDVNRLIEAWLALTFAVNSLNRSMGLHDLYPFVLGPVAVAKLAFVHRLIAATSSAAPKTTSRPPPQQATHSPPNTIRSHVAFLQRE